MAEGSNGGASARKAVPHGAALELAARPPGMNGAAAARKGVRKGTRWAAASKVTPTVSVEHWKPEAKEET